MFRLSIHILRAFIPWLAVALGAAVLIFLATQMIRVAPVFVGAGAGLCETASAVGLALVPVVAWALTPAFAVAAFALAGQLSEDGELIAVDAAGLGRFGVIAAVVALAVAITGLSAWLWLFACPESQARLHALAAELAGKALTDQLETDRFTQVVPGITFFSDEKKQGEFRGILLEQAWDEQNPIHLVARTAQTSLGPASRTLKVRLKRGAAFWGAGGRAAPKAALCFDELDVQVPLVSLVEKRLDFLPRTMAEPTARLLGPPPSGTGLTHWDFALWRRIAGPAGFFVLSSLSLYLAFSATWRRRNAAIAVAAGIFGLFHLAGRLTESLMHDGLVSARSAALLPPILVGIALLAFCGLRFLRFRYAKIVRYRQI